jgi:uncharacterized RDD family membrane protein YckC
VTSAAPDAPDGPADDPTRVITRRVVAFLVDALLIAVLPVLTVLVIGHSRSVHACPQHLAPGYSCFVWKETGAVIENRSLLWFLGLLVVLYVVVFVVVQGLTGASPGKSLLGIRVVDHHGDRPGFVRSAVRAVGWVVDAITLVFPVALWSAWFSPGHRRVGDFLAGTFVVRHGTEHTLAGPAADDATASGG